MTEQKTDGRTRRGADIALAKRTISRASYDAILAGTLSLQQGKECGRDGGPDTSRHGAGPRTAAQISRGASTDDGAHTPPLPVSRISKDDRTPTKTPCLCGCGLEVSRNFSVGHDSRMFRVAREHLTKGRELTDEQREYLESSGKMERVRARLAEEDARRREAKTRKTARKGSR